MDTLTVDQVTKRYNDFVAVDQVSFSVKPGSMFGLLGPNGAGKTTTMRMIMNIILPDSGEIRLFGEPFREEFKDRIGYLPEERGLYPKMKVVDHLQFLGEMKGLSASEARRVSLEWLERFNLADRASKKVQELSKGLQQQMQFIGTILHRPQLLILDEPFSGLDPVNTQFLKDILLDLRQQNTTIIFSTHLMEQAEKLCDEICLINRGKVVLHGNLAEIKRRHSHNAVIVEYSGKLPPLDSLPMVKTVNDYGNYMEVRLRDEATPTHLFKALANYEVDIRRFEAAETSLNQIFIEIVGENNR